MNISGSGDSESRPVPRGLDIEAARRQTFQHSVNTGEVGRLLEGRLTMPPHAEWQLPHEPTWTEDPFQDRNWCFQFHTLRWLEPIRRAAAKGDAAALSMWLHYTEDWTTKNPRRNPASTWAWVDMADGLRAQQLCLGIPLVSEHAPEQLPWLEYSIRDHAEHLADPKHVGKANHALHQAESLFVCGRVLGAESHWELAARRMSSLLKEQYDEQGMNAEGATAYHYNNFLWWERALRRFDAEGLPRPDGAERHLNAPEQIAHATKPDGYLVSIGDTDTQSPQKIAHQHTDYTTSNGTRGAAPEQAVAIYDAGYVFARSGWGDDDRPYSEQTYFTLRFGPSRRVHGHQDGTSITYSSSGVNWLVDPGKYEYGSSTPRLHVISRAAHNVVTVEGRRLLKDSDVELLRRDITPRHHDYVLADPSFDRVSLTRRVIHSVRGEYLVVIDEISGPRRLTAEQRWQLGPEVEAEAVNRSVALSSGNQHAMLWFDGESADVRTVRAQDDPFDGYVSVGWKKLAPATAVIVRKKGARLRFLTVVATGGESQPAVERVQTVSRDDVGLLVTTSHGTEQITISPDDVVFP